MNDGIILFSGTERYKIIDMDRNVVRNSIDLPYKEFQKSKFSSNTTDDYSSFHVFYDKNNICEAIEFFKEYPLSFNGNNVMGMNRQEVKNILLKLDNDMEEDSYGVISNALSIGISCLDDKVETVLVGKQGYYDL